MLKSVFLKLQGPSLSALLLCVLSLAGSGFTRDLRLNFPKRTKPTPVQQLNRDGVKALEKHNYGTARKLFYKAYLLDPDDPFTLNNLGYMAELDGDLERAQRFYDLAQAQSSDAKVDRSTTDEVVGKTVSQVAGHAEQSNLETNRMNVRALTLLRNDRAAEADVILTETLAIDPKNPFTLNNLGFAKEKEGELQAALDYYTRAANLRSEEPVIVTVNSDWRGRPISQVAGENADKMRKLIRKQEDRGAQVARLNLRGVSALNRNDKRSARTYFQQAYQLDPKDAFTLNNMGYVAEMDGDRETAQYYYDKAQATRRSGARVTVATRREAEGRKVASVAESSEMQVERRMAAETAQRRVLGPPALKHRDGQPLAAPAESPGPVLKRRPGAPPPPDATPAPEREQQ